MTSEQKNVSNIKILPGLYGLDEKEMRSLVQAAGFPSFRAMQILNWLYKKNVLTWEEMANLSKGDLAQLAKRARLTTLEFVKEKKATLGTSVKYLFQTEDGHLLESVLISQKESPASQDTDSQGGRETVCVSTQLGCKIKCVFCASGQGKFYRNLSAGEILEQVAQISRKTQKKITNVVFMGMGEPLDNFDATLKAVHILTAPWGFAFGGRRITVSTSGITPRILEFVKSVDGRVRLSVSLHSSKDDVRNELVPINRRYPLKELAEALKTISRDLKREITFEYTLIEGINDSDEEVRGVSALAKPLKAKVNIIPYNPIREFDHPAPSQQTIERFCKGLEKKGLRVMLRQTVGQEIESACGQLRLDRDTPA